VKYDLKRLKDAVNEQIPPISADEGILDRALAKGKRRLSANLPRALTAAAACAPNCVRWVWKCWITPAFILWLKIPIRHWMLLWSDWNNIAGWCLPVRLHQRSFLSICLPPDVMSGHWCI